MEKQFKGSDIFLSQGPKGEIQTSHYVFDTISLAGFILHSLGGVI
jgi:hypothetical protein